MLDLLEAGGDRLRHLALHGGDGGGIVGVDPAMAAHAMGMRHVQGRAEVGVEGLQFGEVEGIVDWRQASGREALGDEGQHGGRFRQHAAIGDQRRHAALGIDLEILGRLLLGLAEVDTHRRIVGADFFQDDVRGERAGMGGVEEFQHAGTLARRAARRSSVKVVRARVFLEPRAVQKAQGSSHALRRRDNRRTLENHR